MRRGFLARTLAVAATTMIAASPVVSQPSPSSPPPGVAAEVVKATNAVRAKHKLPPLRVVGSLTNAATGHSAFLATSGRFQHEDADGGAFSGRLIRAGYPAGTTMAENIAMTAGCGPDTAKQAMALWMASAPHRANILHPKLRAVGVGVAANADCSQVYLTVDFGSTTRAR